MENDHLQWNLLRYCHHCMIKDCYHQDRIFKHNFKVRVVIVDVLSVEEILGLDFLSVTE